MKCYKGSQCDFLHCYVYDPAAGAPFKKEDVCAYFRGQCCRKLNTCKFIHACMEAEILGVCVRCYASPVAMQ